MSRGSDGLDSTRLHYTAGSSRQQNSREKKSVAQHHVAKSNVLIDTTHPTATTPT